MNHLPKRLLAATWIIGMTAMLSACHRGGAGMPGSMPGGGTPTLPVQQVATKTITITESYPATIQGEEVIEIRPKIEGYLEAQYVDEGARVKKGQTLFRISSPQYEQELRSAQAGILSAEADVNAAQMAVNKTKPLVEKEIISKYELQSAEFTLNARKATLAQAQATLANAKANIGYTLISSPADGVIGSIPYKKGSLVNGSTTNPLTTLAADKDVYVYFSLNEKQLLAAADSGKLSDRIAMLPEVGLLLADGSRYAHTGKIDATSGILNTATGSVSVRARFPNPGGVLRSGGSANLQIPRTYRDAIVIPQSATYELQDKRLVYVLGGGNRVMSRAIISEPTNDGQSFVVTSGLRSGERIVTQGVAGLKDSMTIQVQTGR